MTHKQHHCFADFTFISEQSSSSLDVLRKTAFAWGVKGDIKKKQKVSVVTLTDTDN